MNLPAELKRGDMLVSRTGTEAQVECVQEQASDGDLRYQLSYATLNGHRATSARWWTRDELIEKEAYIETHGSQF
jgi:hypothetical protein